MSWFLTLAPTFLILWVHFRNQKNQEYLSRASNFWVVFYIVGYFLPIPLFVAGEDGWSKNWGYPFHDFKGSLNLAVLLATAGGLVLSLSAGPGRRRPLKKAAPTLVAENAVRSVGEFASRYHLVPLRLFLLVSICLGSLLMGIQLVGGLSALIAGLGDRITLFAGFNAFFLPVNMLIGICFAISAQRTAEGNIPAWVEWLAIALTLPALFLLGQKSNLFILFLGIAIIKLLNRGDVKLAWIVLAAFLMANLLLVYEFVFREALIIGLDPERLTISSWSSYLFASVTGNIMQIQNLTVLVDALPKFHPYSMGETYLAFFSLIVPQALIGAKPLSAAGAHTLMFWPEVVARESTTMPPGLFGEAYLNFGPLGFLILCLIAGLILRKVDRPFRRRKKMTLMQIVSVAIFGSMSLHFVRGEFFAPFLIFVSLFFGARFVFGKRRALSSSIRFPKALPPAQADF